MSDLIEVLINGETVAVMVGSTVAAAMAIAQVAPRKSEHGEPRTALCGMGICFECRAIVNGVPHVRTCQTNCEPGMDVKTNA
jgi:sarcosine oxidase subunit alpha